MLHVYVIQEMPTDLYAADNVIHQEAVIAAHTVMLLLHQAVNLVVHITAIHITADAVQAVQIHQKLAVKV